MKSNKALKVITVILAVALAACLFYSFYPKLNDPSVKVYDDKYVKNTFKRDVKMQFNKDGKFKIVVFSDLHSDVNKAPKYMKLVVDKENPDLIMITGDVELYKDIPTTKKYIETAFSYFDEKKIPWGHTYGNHDIEYAAGKSTKEIKSEVQAAYESSPYNISKAGPKDIDGVGNYVFPVYGSDGETIAMTVWGLDSNMYLENNFKEMPALVNLPNTINGGYKWDYIKPNQVIWYYNTSEAIERYANKKIPGLMFFHIPLPEMNYISNNPKETNMVGKKREPVNCSEVNSGLFSFILSRKDICGIFNGHDHVNDFTGEYVGVRMSYVPCITHQNYHDKNVMGARVIEIDENDVKNFETRIVYLLKEGFYDDSLDREDPVELSAEQLQKYGVTRQKTANIPLKLNEPGMLLNFNNFVSSQKEDLVAKGSKATLGTVFRSGVDIPPSQFPYAVLVDNGYNSKGVGIIKDEGKDYARLSFYFPEKEYKGEKYLRLYVDFTDMDWNMGSFALINKEGAIFESRNNMGKEYLGFFYLPEGETDWRYYTHSNQGRVGSTQKISLYNFKGWIALEVKDLLASIGPATNPQTDRDGTFLKPGEILRGFNFRYNLLHDSMIKKPFVVDEVAITNEYWVFN